LNMQNDTIPPDMEGKPVGTILKEVRESGGLTLDDAVRITRIGKSYLRALEEGRYDRLPNEAYIKGFLRVYAAYLKLPEDEIVLAYEKCLSDKCPSTDDVALKTEKKQIRNNSFGIPFKRIYPVFFFIALIAVSAYLITVPADKDVDVKVSKNSNGKNSSTVPGNADIPAVSSPAVIQADNKAPAHEDEEAKMNGPAKDTKNVDNLQPVTKGLVLKIKVVEDGWLDVTIDDAVTQHYELKSGDLIEWKGDRGFMLDVGNAGGVEAELNGKTLKPFGKIGESAHVVLDASGVKD
jgi:cytoskeleton protein RodZ